MSVMNKVLAIEGIEMREELVIQQDKIYVAFFLC